jgi:UDP-N-acetylmuramate--alanine ligase
MKPGEIHTFDSVYMIGIGGIGMSALARYFLVQGKRVAGYDRVSTRLTDDLIREGSDIHFTVDLSWIKENFPDPENLLVIYTPAIPEEHIELDFFRKGGYQVIKRAEMLGILSSQEPSIAVAGTHGKTTISTMIAHLLKVAGIPCNAFLGGISKNYGTNAIFSDDAEWMVLEADEYDRSFLWLSPHVAIVSSCDPDHLDIYGNLENLQEAFCEFIGQVKEGGKLIIREGLNLPCEDSFQAAVTTYLLDNKARFSACNIRQLEGRCLFDAVTPGGVLPDLELGIPGRINIENALACICTGRLLGIKDDDIRAALSSFSGVQRRFDVRIRRDDMVYIDDYAHHPRELEACIGSVRENYPGRRITGVFQPHLFSRTRDFAGGFASSLSGLDELILLDIYPAREKPIEGITSKIIYDAVELDEKMLIQKEQVLAVLSERKPELLLTLGAGDIDQLVGPITDLYSGNKGN